MTITSTVRPMLPQPTSPDAGLSDCTDKALCAHACFIQMGTSSMWPLSLHDLILHGRHNGEGAFGTSYATLPLRLLTSLSLPFGHMTGGSGTQAQEAPSMAKRIRSQHLRRRAPTMAAISGALPPLMLTCGIFVLHSLRRKSRALADTGNFCATTPPSGRRSLIKRW